MRLLVTTDVVGGVWSYTQELIEALERRGHACALVAFGGEPSAAQTAWARGRPGLEFTAVRCPLEWMPEPEPGLSRSVRTLRRIARRFRPDVVHLNQFVYGAADLGAPKLVVAHSDVVTWWRAVRGGEPPDDAWFRRYRRWVRDGLEGAEPGGRIAADLACSHGTRAVYSPANLLQPAAIEEMVEVAEREFGAVDILVNNAGIQHTARVETFPPCHWDAILGVNLSA
ncbi:MAG: SDR family NAD(P)-dependent oxidoreductase, partial [Gemmatimonadota bacterium]